MKAVIVDDERLARLELRRLLAVHPAIEIAGEAADAPAARTLLETHAPDLVFLDIELPGENAFALLTSLDRVPHVIFTTAYDAHAVRAFEVDALDFLVKPIVAARLATAVTRALATSQRGPRDRVFVRDGARSWFVDLHDVEVIESDGNYARLDLPGQPMLPRSLAALEERLGAAFFRASRKHLVNLARVASVRGDGAGLALVMQSGRVIELSRRAAQRFRSLKAL